MISRKGHFRNWSGFPVGTSLFLLRAIGPLLWHLKWILVFDSLRWQDFPASITLSQVKNISSLKLYLGKGIFLSIFLTDQFFDILWRFTWIFHSAFFTVYICIYLNKIMNVYCIFYLSLLWCYNAFHMSTSTYSLHSVKQLKIYRSQNKTKSLIILHVVVNLICFDHYCKYQKHWL